MGQLGHNLIIGLEDTAGRGALKMEDQKMQDLKMQDQMSAPKNAGPENEGPNYGT